MRQATIIVEAYKVRIMKHTFILSLLLVMCFLSVTFANEEPENSRRPREEKRARQQELYEKRTQAKELAREVLAGRQVAVRVYNNWQKDARAFERVSVQLKELSVGLDAVESAFGEISESAVIVVTAEDQKDEAVAAVVGDFIYAELYKKGKSFSIWPKHIGDIADKWHVFKDAQGNPIPHATVEIMIASNPYWSTGPRASIGKVKLDEKGRLKPPKSTSTLRHFCFMLFHPDYCSTPVQASPHIYVENTLWANFVPVLPIEKWCVFKDALGEPIPEATVEIFEGSNWEKRKPDSIGKSKLDEKGRLRPPESNPRLQLCCFIVSHPDYGTALVEPRWYAASLNELLTSCTVPLVRIGTKADERSIWGTVVDPNGNPVAGALVTCIGVTTPGGGRIRSASTPSYQPLRTITCEQGHFALYLPIEKDSEKHGSLVPLASKYHVWIEAPKVLGLQRYSANVNSGEETTITMVAVEQGGYFHTFAFEDATGPITDPNRLAKIRLAIKQPDKGTQWSYDYDYDKWKNGAMFPLGTYKALSPGPRPLTFEPIEIAEDSLELLIFKAQPGIIYYGQVVHGITGEPMAGVIVITGHLDLGGKDASSLTPQQWDALYALGADPYADDQTLAELQKAYNFEKVTLTGEDGWYHISYITGKDRYFSAFIALKKDYLGARGERRYFVPPDDRLPGEPSFKELKPDKDRYAEVPTIKLFPAATLLIEPNVPVRASDDDVRLDLYMNQDDNPPWASDFWSYFGRGKVVHHEHFRPPNEVHSTHVPAGLEMTIRVFDVRKSQWCPIIIPGIKLEQGQVLDLGRQDFQPTLKVSVRVVDSKEQPVEGVAVRCTSGGLFWGQAPITNENGIVLVNVPPYSKGEFVIQYYEDTKDPNTMHLREGVAYEIGGEEDVGHQFTLQISDEMLYQLFK